MREWITQIKGNTQSGSDAIQTVLLKVTSGRGILAARRMQWKYAGDLWLGGVIWYARKS